MKTQLQPIYVVSQTRQHRLLALRLIAAPWRFRKKLPFDRRKHALDVCPLRVLLTWEALPHLRANTFDLPLRFTSLGRDYALGSDHLPDVLVISLRIKLRIRKHQPDWRHLLRGIDQRSQSRAVII